MKRYSGFLLVLFVVACATASAQTTFILVRHAEKESTANDPGLTKEGQERAQALARLLDKQKVDAIFSTNYNRTKNTVQPLANAKSLTVTSYESLKPEELIEKYTGGVVVICGHSNTIPQLANTLLGNSQFSNYADSDYGNLLVITSIAVGKGTVTHLRY